MMRDITHSDGVLPPWDWLMAFSLNAKAKETKWGRKCTGVGLPCSALLMLCRLPLPLQSYFVVIVVYFIHSCWFVYGKTQRGPDVIKSKEEKAAPPLVVEKLLFTSQIWRRVFIIVFIKVFLSGLKKKHPHGAFEWWAADVSWDSVPDVKSCSSKKYAIILSTICAPLS